MLACLGAVWACVAGCYHHQAAHTPVAVAASGLPAARSGHYTLTMAGQPVGAEYVTITSSSAWALTGRIEWTEPVPATTRYTLRVAQDQPQSLEVRLELMSQARVMTATLSEGYLQVHVAGMGPALTRKVAYGAGTSVQAVSPLLHTWVLGLLSPRLLPGQRVAVRTVDFEPPLLAPKVELQTFEVLGEQDGLRKIRVLRPAPAPPQALWVAPDGFVMRARTWPKGLNAPFLERRWTMP